MREKKAREEAETILEEKSLELYYANQELRDREQKIALRYEITRILVEHETIEEAAPLILEIMCQSMQLKIGGLWRIDKAKKGLVPVAIWHVNDPKIETFANKTKQFVFLSNMGLPGRVWATKKIAWIEDVNEDSNFPRKEMAKEADLHSGFAFPVLFENEVLGVIEFFMHDRKLLDEKLINMIDDISKQFGISIEREQAQKRITALSRRAGMSEVATSVLHNIGNILNSVNVSIEVVQNSLNESSFKNLTQITEMIKDHYDNLNQYLFEDPKGKLLLKYLIPLVEQLKKEHLLNLNEIQSLKDSIKHIEDIVGTQKIISGISGVTEKVFLSNVIDSAIEMCSASIEKTDIKIEKEVIVNIFVITDISKLLQILVNLIQNAKYALASSDYIIPNKKITIKIHNHKDNKIDITISDNGIGIEQKNLINIFSLGFTTKITGHGFGLHSSAIAANELGGSLRAISEGKGKGATFILTIPINNSSHKDMTN